MTTSRIARRMGFASRLTARSVAHLGDEGVAVALLGMFEQGFYDRLGFGVGSYENRVSVYPGDLDVPVPYRRPVRFDIEGDDLTELHEAMVTRLRPHGGIVIGGEVSTGAGFLIDDEPTAFGYRTDGAISHYVCVASKGENGPDRVTALVYQDLHQCLELFRLLQEWGDQVDSIRFDEPVWMQSQDFMKSPGREYRRTKGTDSPMRIDADAWWQLRIVDLPACVAAVSPAADSFALVVDLHDPITPHLTGSGYDGDWKPLTGLWRLSFGETCTAERLSEPAEPNLRASINALSRWWLGVLPATVLHAMGEFEGEPETMAELDGLTAHLPTPQLAWDI